MELKTSVHVIIVTNKLKDVFVEDKRIHRVQNDQMTKDGPRKHALARSYPQKHLRFPQRHTGEISTHKHMGNKMQAFHLQMITRGIPKQQSHM